MKIGFIGLGIMGSRMAARILDAGYELYGYNRTKNSAMADLAAKGAKVLDSPSAIAEEADVIITMLANPSAVRSVAMGDGESQDGFLNSLRADRENLIWIDSSTVDPAFSREMAELARQKGIVFVDAPVAGSKMPAQKGELLFLAGGDGDIVAQVTPLLETMGSKVLHLGPAGSGTGMKMLINYLLGQGMLAFAEALALGRGMGFDNGVLMDTLLAAPVSAPFLAGLRPRLEGEDTETHFPMKHLEKDLRLALESAESSGIMMESGAAGRSIFAEALSAGYADRDFSAISEYLQGKSRQ